MLNDVAISFPGLGIDEIDPPTGFFIPGTEFEIKFYGLIIAIGMLLAVYTLFRIFSRNTAKRRQENDKYIAWRRDFSTTASQSWNRLKNIRKYKYFKCPECHAMLRLPRKVGEVNVTCKHCGHTFSKKA